MVSAPLLARFAVKASNVVVLGSPEQYYEELVSGIKRATKRCNLTTLYIGAEQRGIIESIVEKSRYIPVSTLTDFCRSLRPDTVPGQKKRTSSAWVMQEQICRQRQLLRALKEEPLPVAEDLRQAPRPSVLVELEKADDTCGASTDPGSSGGIGGSSSMSSSLIEEALNSLAAESFTPTAELKPTGTGSLRVSFYQTPVPGWLQWQRWFPYRMQETLGVLHWKFYVFDDDVIITGANVSSTYLKDRHDRWILISNEPSLCDTLCEIADTLAEASFQLAPDNPEFRSRGIGLKRPIISVDEALKKVELCLQKSDQLDVSEEAEDMMYLSLGIHCGYAKENCALQYTEPLLLTAALQPLPSRQASDAGPEGEEESTVVMSSPYLNLSPETISLLQSKLPKKRVLHIVGPSPITSSFFNAGPVIAAIPFAYLQLTVRALYELSKCLSVRYSSFIPTRGSTTFHAKGVWNTGFTIDGRLRRVRTIAGSSNFSMRSQNRDLECLFLIDTTAPRLVAEFDREVDALRASSEQQGTWSFLLESMNEAKWSVRLIAKFFATNTFFRSLL